MKKSLLTLVLLSLTLSLSAAYLENVPQTIIQPNGDTLRCFATGDEFYHRLHDKAGYTIVQDPLSGYFVYATMSAEGELVPTALIPGHADPASHGIMPNLKISERAYEMRLKQWEVPEEYQSVHSKSAGSITHGTLHNIIVFISFADDDNFPTPYHEVNQMMNDSSSNSESVWAYFRSASYGNLRVVTHFYPGHDGDVIISYKDSHPRCDFMPYNAYSNPTGYTDQAQTEFALLERATNYLNANYPIPSDFNIDIDGNGEVDNIVFLLTGSYTGWSDLLWPHKWNIYGNYNVQVGGKQVSTFNLMLAGAGDDYFCASTFCHEMFHSMGAPDLYRYYNGTNVTPVGQWDLMSTNTRPPQHMGAWLKYHVGHWIDSIPTISKSGLYHLRSLGDASPSANTCYKILTKDQSQFYLLEYRDRSERFEHTLPGKGLVITRINTRFDGNAGYNPRADVYDGSWIFRPNSNYGQYTGELASAALSASSGRTEFSYRTEPYPFLTDGSIDTSFRITHISDGGEELTFCLEHPGDCNLVDQLANDSITVSSARLSWRGFNDSYVIYVRNMTDSLFEGFTPYFTDSCFLDLYDLESNCSYEWYVRGICGDDTSYSIGSKHFKTQMCDSLIMDTIGRNSNVNLRIPVTVTSGYCYSMQLFMPEDLPGPMDITSINIYYNSREIFNKGNTTLFMGNTDKRFFANKLDYINAYSMHRVFNGDITFNQGWTAIQLDKPFYYDGESSIVLAFHDNSGITASATHQFGTSRCDSARALVLYSNDQDPDPYNLSHFTGSKELINQHNYIIFNGCGAEPGRIVPPDPVNINEVDNTPIHIWAENDQVHIEGAQGRPIAIYDLMGRIVYQKTKATANECINIPQSGLYLVRSAGIAAEKVMIRNR